ncbi:MAG: type I-U CRISPR-associated RAMP protein Csb1/Cas7u [Gammaproteobacteria bacterium]
MNQNITLEELKNMVEKDAVAIRGRAILEPAGGPGDKVFPPSHSVDEKRAASKYAFETRRRGGSNVVCVLIDSVQSQANRMEEALQVLWTDKRITLPVIEVDLSTAAPDVGKVTSLTAPHRVADALLRDSLVNENGKDTLFRMSTLGRSFTDATPRNAGPLFKVCPTGLVFGIWDSTGPKGGMGAKFARALTSEIVGVGAGTGVKTASRIDPTSIVTKAAAIYEAADKDERWTFEPDKAKKDAKGNPVKIGDGRVSEINHSNIPPTIDTLAGGVTIDHAEHTVVLSLAGLRRLRFVEGGADARTVLAALALVAVLAAENRGHDLRSRCLLVPREGNSLTLEAVAGDGSMTPVTLDLDGALALYEEAVKALPSSLRFEKPPGVPLDTLTPSPKLAHLITESRKLAAAGADIGEE